VRENISLGMRGNESYGKKGEKEKGENKMYERIY